MVDGVAVGGSVAFHVAPPPLAADGGVDVLGNAQGRVVTLVVRMPGENPWRLVFLQERDHVADVRVAGTCAVLDGNMPAEDDHLRLGHVGKVGLEPCPLLVCVAEGVVGGVGGAVVDDVAHAHHVDVAPVEREVHGTEGILELALGAKIKGAALSIDLQRVRTAVEEGVVVVAHGLEHWHVDLAEVRTHGGHAAVGIPAAFGVHDVSQGHTVARQRLLCYAIVDCRHGFLVETVRVGLAGAPVAVVGLGVCQGEEHELILHRLAVQGEVVAGGRILVAGEEIRPAVGLLCDLGVGRNGNVDVPAVRCGVQPVTAFGVGHGHGESVADAHACCRAAVGILHASFSVIHAGRCRSGAVSVDYVSRRCVGSACQVVPEVAGIELDATSGKTQGALDLDGFGFSAEHDILGGLLVVGAEHHARSATVAGTGFHIAQHLAGGGGSQVHTAVAAYEAAHAEECGFGHHVTGVDAAIEPVVLGMESVDASDCRVGIGRFHVDASAVGAVLDRSGAAHNAAYAHFAKTAHRDVAAVGAIRSLAGDCRVLAVGPAHDAADRGIGCGGVDVQVDAAGIGAAGYVGVVVGRLVVSRFMETAAADAANVEYVVGT